MLYLSNSIYKFILKTKLENMVLMGHHIFMFQRVIDKLGIPEHSKIIVAHLGAGGS